MQPAVFVALFVSLTIPFVFALLGKDWQAAQDKARERRMAEHRMNARLLRLDI